MINMKYILLLFFTLPIISIGQKDTLVNTSRKNLRKNMPSYINISAGKSRSSFRDFGTSPLTYKGTPNFIAISRSRQNEQKEFEIGSFYSFGDFKVDYNEHKSTSKLQSLSIYYSQLYRVKKLSTEKLTTKVGGLFNTTGNLRNNASLQNNALGREIIATLFGSAKVSWDISRNQAKSKKILFFNYHLKPKTRHLDYRLNIGLINSALRNGYAYIGQSSVLNDPKVFEGYKYNLFSGFRLSSAVDYTVLLKNNNSLQLSYLWEAYKTGGKFDQLEMASHTIKATLMFNYK